MYYRARNIVSMSLHALVLFGRVCLSVNYIKDSGLLMTHFNIKRPLLMIFPYNPCLLVRLLPPSE